MRIRRISLAAISSSALAAAAMIGTLAAYPPELNADPGIGGCVDVVGVSACSNVDVNVPNINAVANAIPNIPVPNINVPNVHINPGHVGLPGRGR